MHIFMNEIPSDIMHRKMLDNILLFLDVVYFEHALRKEERDDKMCQNIHGILS